MLLLQEPGHKIRTCRYKRRRDKLRKATTSPVENLKTSVSINLAKSEALCCSFPHDAPNTDIDACVDEDTIPQHDPLSKNVSVIQNHHDDTCVKLMKYNWKFHVVKCFSVSWLFSLSWMRNPFCMERCKRELCWLLSFAWLAEMFSFFDHKYGADEQPRMFAYCTLDSPRPLQGTYNLSTKCAVPTWKKKKKKRRR